MIEEYLKEAEKRMKGAVSKFKEELSGIRTGRASTGLVENIKVEYYGSEIPLKQIATISTPEPSQILIQTWDKGAVKSIEKALIEANLGANPQTEGNIIRLNLPPMTEERRKEVVKLVHKFAEEARVAVRNIRRDEKENIEKLKKEGFSEDDVKKALDKLQKLTDKYIDEINQLTEAKEKEILSI
ncbi:MAG: ribosome recycling factor [Sulfurihydrogenibium sp.]|jgi:ribosome recycling factor|uniref:Ribosome-recycling factor n=1 Tax=Sulfurihydrogenibium azorense TaxID=309806 RepID=A0A831YEW6_9AQUI|nr:MAG: ribosome recycling factor [Sulfurihydrogenibium sp.]PMP76890.1 MAG: ribosome recycling factor [Sulfurihydrogenibium sp.]HEV09571.1 ribosome recycling factor [Sulfurihydrogenibium azorense]